MVKYDDKPIPHDPEWKGPLKDRSCTDIPCLLIFVAFVTVWVILGSYALASGNVATLLAPTDTQGRKCGIDSEVAEKPYLLFFDLTKCDIVKKRCLTTEMCVEKCPNVTWTVTEHLNDVENIRKNIICVPDINIADKSLSEIRKYRETEACTSWYAKSRPIVKRCFPIEVPFNFAEEKLKEIQEIFDYLAYAQGVMEKIATTYKTVILIIAGGALMSIIFMLLLKWIALPAVFIAIVGVCGLFFYLTYRCYESYEENKSTTWLTLTIVFGCIGGIIALISACLWSRIYLACQLIKEASSLWDRGLEDPRILNIQYDRHRFLHAINWINRGYLFRAVMAVLSSLFFPILPWLLHLGILIYSFYAAFCLVSIGEQTFKIEEKGSNNQCICSSALNYTVGASCDPKTFSDACKENGEVCVSMGCHSEGIESPSYMNILYLIHLIGALWVYFFVSALGEMTLAATFATWYWTFDKRDVPFLTITVSFWRTLKYHLGTVAFGSFLITICRFFRILLEYVHAQSMQQEQLLGSCGRAILRCTQCFMAYLERFLKFMNRNAYIVCAVYGRGLCLSAADALSLLMRNVLRVIVLNKLVDWLLFGGKILVTCTMIAASWWHFKENEVDNEFWWVPTILVGCGTYLVASLFFGVYDTAVDTIFLCFLEDCERHDGSAEKPYYMTRGLAKVLNLK